MFVAELGSIRGFGEDPCDDECLDSKGQRYKSDADCPPRYRRCLQDFYEQQFNTPMFLFNVFKGLAVEDGDD